jgi:hypothetical protein
MVHLFLLESTKPKKEIIVRERGERHTIQSVKPRKKRKRNEKEEILGLELSSKTR